MISWPRPVSVEVTSCEPLPTSRVPCSIDAIAACVCSLTVWISASMSFADWPTRRASDDTSSATTAKPRPCSPACAASIDALSASIEVCSLIWRITSTMLPIRLLLSPSSRIFSAASSTAAADLLHALTAEVTAVLDCSATSVACAALPATCWIDADSSVTAVVELSILSVWSLSPPSISRDAALISALDAPTWNAARLHAGRERRAPREHLVDVVGEVRGLVARADHDPLGQIGLAREQLARLLDELLDRPRDPERRCRARSASDSADADRRSPATAACSAGIDHAARGCA